MIKIKLENETPTCVLSYQKLLLSEISLFHNLNIVNDDVLCLQRPLVAQINSSQKKELKMSRRWEPLLEVL